jgi:hypothetical protein
MKNKLFFLIMLICLLTLSFIGCKNDDNEGGGKVPSALQGNWLRDSQGIERHLTFTKDG